MFTPTCFITVGETGAMFTLRVTYLHVYSVGGRIERRPASWRRGRNRNAAICETKARLEREHSATGASTERTKEG